ncbi:hypothetical protein VULLAG_LOCUS16145 [Vulpes lagopus]
MGRGRVRLWSLVSVTGRAGTCNNRFLPGLDFRLLHLLVDSSHLPSVPSTRSSTAAGEVPGVLLCARSGDLDDLRAASAPSSPTDLELRLLTGWPWPFQALFRPKLVLWPKEQEAKQELEFNFSSGVLASSRSFLSLLTLGAV